MGYMHILNLYRLLDFLTLAGDEIYALEKIHGTSAWINHNVKLSFYSGGVKNNDFVCLFDEKFLDSILINILNENDWASIRIHGEAYGANLHKMSDTYGLKTKFVVFDVRVRHKNDPKVDIWLDVPEAETIATRLNLEFVDYVKGPNTKEWIEEQAHRESTQAIRNGMGHNKKREGVVIKPLHEKTYSHGLRLIAKHKIEEFRETKNPRPLDGCLSVLSDATKITDEWITEERSKHVIDHILKNKDNKVIEASDIKNYIDTMLEDVLRESEGEIIKSLQIERAIKTISALKFKQYMFDNKINFKKC